MNAKQIVNTGLKRSLARFVVNPCRLYDRNEQGAVYCSLVQLSVV